MAEWVWENSKHASLRKGVVTSSLKWTVVSPLLKKPNLDTGALNNYCQASNIPFLNKVIEEVVAGHFKDC